MLEINVREARKNLSELLDRVARGEEVIVLRRGEAVARVSRPQKPRRKLPSLAAFRARIAAGKHSSTDLVRQERDER